MGYMTAYALAEQYGDNLAAGVAGHLRHNCYPPVPLEMVQACVDAIWMCVNQDEAEEPVSLPDGVTCRYGTVAPAWYIVREFKLQGLVDYHLWSEE